MSRGRWGISRLFMILSVTATLVAAAATAPASAEPSTAEGGHGPSSEDCHERVNNTPGKLLPCIRTDDLWHHMRVFQAIANAHPGPDGHPSRNSGEPGYKASADYVAQ